MFLPVLVCLPQFGSLAVMCPSPPARMRTGVTAAQPLAFTVSSWLSCSRAHPRSGVRLQPRGSELRLLPEHLAPARPLHTEILCPPPLEPQNLQSWEPRSQRPRHGSVRLGGAQRRGHSWHQDRRGSGPRLLPVPLLEPPPPSPSGPPKWGDPHITSLIPHLSCV